MTEYAVVNADSKDLVRRVTLQDAVGKKSTLNLHRLALIGKGDRVYINPEHPSRISVLSCENVEDKIKVTPHFEQSFETRIGASKYQGKISELVTKDALDAYEYLERFHYKTSISAVDEVEDDESEARGETQTSLSVGGRKVVLLASVRVGRQWTPIGYIELHMPLLMAKPRHTLFAHPFKHPERPISWDTWDQHSIKEYVNCIVRIARVVTSPEFRGLGIARILINSAKGFASERWHVKGRRPLFIEISAEMLRHLDFVTSAGIPFAGNTEGNLSRVAKDLTYMDRDYEVGSGIMSLQKKYLVKLKHAADVLSCSFESMLQKVAEVAQNPDQIKFLSPSEYYYMKAVLRFPIPYHIGGLDRFADEYLHQARSELETRHPDALVKPSGPVQLRVQSGRVQLSSLSISTHYKLPDNQHVRAITDCFGIDAKEITSRIVTDMPLEASGGNIIFISGASGSGKSLFLKAIDPSEQLPHVNFKRIFAPSNKFRAGWIRDLPDGVPLIEYFSDRWGMDKALSALNQAGLSEAFVYLKPFSLLSRGQKYRARLADLALRDDQVWLIDEFCADLDPMTARIVATNLRKHVIKFQRIAFVAAANHDHYLDALRPTRVIRLREGFTPEQYSYKEFIDEFHSKDQ